MERMASVFAQHAKGKVISLSEDKKKVPSQEDFKKQVEENVKNQLESLKERQRAEIIKKLV